MSEQFKNTHLWKKSFQKRRGAPAEESSAIDRLQVALLKMRENTSWIVSQIHADCKGLTIHDVSHLDALWETADLILGDTYDLNPAEGFVLGGAFLLHDAGMTVAAFPGGRTEIEATPEWRENRAAIVRSIGIAGGRIDPRSLSSETQDQILFATLRELHPSQAAKLATQAWPKEGGGELYLIDDSELRESYGTLIGKIAHSHHWNVERVGQDLHPHFNAAIDLPQTWIVNPIKIACILRCADAAHIDKRRAPSFIYALSKPMGLSREHWEFQNKLNKAATLNGKLQYTSGSPFLAEDASSWWMAYDTINMIDRELGQVDSLLDELGIERFSVTGVHGARNPNLLARLLEASGWEPVDAQVTVSDPVTLARTLGGQNLYGKSSFPAVRELVQNAADAIRARRSLEERDEDWGTIRISVKKSGDGGCWLHIDDDGIGMSRRVLTGTLLDFGKSIWNSTLLRDEYPRLLSKGISPIGKFGIGFFSVFMISAHVRVISRRYDQSEVDTCALVFSGLGSRPILRHAEPGELPRDTSTRVSLLIQDPTNLIEMDANLSAIEKYFYPARAESTRKILLSDETRRLISTLDISVSYNDELSGCFFSHAPNWLESDPAVFLEELYGERTLEQLGEFRECYESLLQPLVDENGQVCGRAAIPLESTSLQQRHLGGFVSVGGLCSGSNYYSDYVGVLTGEPTSVSRNDARASTPQDVIDHWIESQTERLSKIEVHDTVRLRTGAQLFQRGSRHPQLPICFFENSLRSLNELKTKLEAIRDIRIPLKTSYDNNYEVIGFSDLSLPFGMKPMSEECMVFTVDSERLLDENAARTLAVSGESTIEISQIREEVARYIIRVISELWSTDLHAEIRDALMFSKPIAGLKHRRLALCISKSSK